MQLFFVYLYEFERDPPPLRHACANQLDSGEERRGRSKDGPRNVSSSSCDQTFDLTHRHVRDLCSSLATRFCGDLFQAKLLQIGAVVRYKQNAAAGARVAELLTSSISFRDQVTIYDKSGPSVGFAVSKHEAMDEIQANAEHFGYPREGSGIACSVWVLGQLWVPLVRVIGVMYASWLTAFSKGSFVN